MEEGILTAEKTHIGVFVASESFKVDALRVDVDAGVVPADPANPDGQSVDVAFLLLLFVPQLHLRCHSINEYLASPFRTARGCWKRYLESVEVGDGGMVGTTRPPQGGVGNSDLTWAAFSLRHEDGPLVVDFDEDWMVLCWTFHIDGVVQDGVVGVVIDAGCSDVDVFDEGARVGVEHNRPVDSSVVKEVKVVLLLVVAGRVAHAVVMVNYPACITPK